MVMVKRSAELTLRDRLSRLSYLQACKLLGEEGARLIQQGGKRDIEVGEQARLDDRGFLLRLPEATVAMGLDARARDRITWRCSSCSTACEHAGAAFSLILEEKMALGLSEAPPERIPVESLAEEDLVRRAIEERKDRAAGERMRWEPRHPRSPWSDYLVTNPLSGKTYRVALRGREPGDPTAPAPTSAPTPSAPASTSSTSSRGWSGCSRRGRWRRPYRRDLVRPPPLRQGAGAAALPAGGPGDEAARLLRPIGGAAIQRARPPPAHPAGGEDGPGGGDLSRRRGVHPGAPLPGARRRGWWRRSGAIPPAIRCAGRSCGRSSSPTSSTASPSRSGAGRAVLADDMGLGKTIQGIGVAELLAREAGIGQVLVVCPTSLKAQWREEILRFSRPRGADRVGAGRRARRPVRERLVLHHLQLRAGAPRHPRTSSG